LRKFLVLFLATALTVGSAPAFSAGPPVTPPGLARSVEAAEARANEAKEDSRNAAAGAAQAANEAAAAAREAAAAERDAPGSVGNAKRQEAQEKADAAREAAVLAREKAQDAAQAHRDAALARAIENSNGKAAKALNKIKGAKEECVDFIETGESEDAELCPVAEYVVKFNAGVDASYQVAAMRSAKYQVKSTFEGVISGAVANLSAKQLLALGNSGRVQTIEENITVTASETQVSPEWGLDRIDQVALPLSSTYTNANNGSGVNIYVVDTGIRSSHVEFSGRVASGYTAINDGNGTLDCNGHGTHVAGIAAGTSYGVAKAATLVPVRVLGCDGQGTLSGVLSGLDWIARNAAPGAPSVVNMSLGGLASDTLDAAVQSLISRGITVVVAAGNEASDACLYSPARVPAAITVAASSRVDQFASFSNSGGCVDLVAPGSEIKSAVSSSNSATAIYSGTSMAAPHAAGSVASLMTAGYLTPGEVSYRLDLAAANAVVTSVPERTPNKLLQLAAVPTPEPEQPATEDSTGGSTGDSTGGSTSGSTGGSTGGSAPAVEEPKEFATAPVAPVITNVNLWRNAARLTWSVPANGGAPITSQTVRIWERGQLVRKIEVAPGATTLRITGLRYNVSYTFTVLATNEIGTSVDSLATNQLTPRIPRR